MSARSSRGAGGKRPDVRPGEAIPGEGLTVTRPGSIRRWLVPVSGIALAFAALGSLVANELASEPAAPAVAASSPCPARGDEPRAASLEAPEATLQAPEAALEAPQALAAAPGAESGVAASPGRGETSRVVVRTLPIGRGVEGEPRRTALTGDANALAQASNAIERFRLLGEIASREDAIDSLESLLDAPLPGTPYEVQTLRLAILGKIGAVPCARAHQILVAHLDPDCPRPERLLALEVLASRPGAGRATIEGVARDDHDVVVQDRARALLARGS